jgi:hypothetical protein
LWKVYGHHHDLVNRYGIAVLQMTTNMLCLLFMTIAGLVTRVTNGCQILNRNCIPLWATELFITSFMEGLCCSFFCCLRHCFFSFGHYIVLPSSSYCCWIPLCYLQSFPKFMLLVIDVKQLLNYPPFSMHFSDLTLLFGMLINILF